MKRHILCIVSFICLPLGLFAQLTTIFEQSNGLKTATYEETISFYKTLASQHPNIKIEEAGPTDTYYPLHVVYYQNNGQFDVQGWKKKGNIIILINNGIHPGEPDGIDASMMLLRDAAAGKINIPDNVMLAVIPVFNIGGALNRNSYSRTNQNGPVSYGFRGSAQNLDLNRDFIKMDAQETQSLVALFHKLDPEIFIDNHVSNGADYSHVMTLLSTQHSKLGGTMGEYLNTQLEPMIYKDMEQRGYDLVPYVNHWGHTPDSGWIAFHEGPRFASGFTTLFQTYGFVPETHMLKPFKQRVKATYTLMQSIIMLGGNNAAAIINTRRQDRQRIQNADALPIAWEADTTHPSYITFKGYEAAYKPSRVSGEPRLYYDRSKPYTKQIPFYNTYTVHQQVTVPEAYVIGQGWNRAIQRLKINGVRMQAVERDTMLTVQVYYIEDYETVKRPYEGHYLHSGVKVRKETKQISILKGDYIIPTAQPAKRYLTEVLEPTAPDALFAWGFFDAILQQKEYFSDYVFEDDAATLLEQDNGLRNLLQTKKQADTTFANDSRAQLDFIYRHSPHYEEVHMRYPVFRLE